MSEPRKLEVLRAIVEDYVHSREPVGSKALVERHHLGVSSATIRNDMAALEDEGLITAPHTSAGRIPTDKGYRLFVDRISAVKPLSAAERRAIQSLLEGSDDLDDVLERTVRLLAQLTNQVAVVQYPHLSRALVRHIEFVLLAPRQVLIVLIADTGKVEQRVIDVGQEIADDALSGLRARFLQRRPAPSWACCRRPCRPVVPAAGAVSGAHAAQRLAPGWSSWPRQPRRPHGHGRHSEPGPVQRRFSAEHRPGPGSARGAGGDAAPAQRHGAGPPGRDREHRPREPVRRPLRGLGGGHGLRPGLHGQDRRAGTHPHGLSHHHGGGPCRGPLPFQDPGREWPFANLAL